ncbi:MAG: Lrp/AsnC ligand binding domain-containing protein [archaeon YNP-LCB-003-016]|jgi:DNA-binding Lrp family transcriptional regulator|uniref:Lrp/AsnC ligand binding domain-containing protein n=1 Tax=Candidatus Culexarchaeum yellowstonense TaxID=2928963 RepID=UPI0026F037DB|nr:Lrp/AsnC ligand binding domain-containing protein [Candidatus Culexarchaeum yellowstonense]MCR6691194.1 Lrp/AsnC ligand binding domain-containing protein [Candidatus Culexarchaeum yellowstonense]
MPVKAFVLINTQIGSEEEVLKDLKGLEEVEEAHIVYGVYDIVAKVTAEDINKLRDIVTMKIRKMKKIMSTTTMIVIEERRK